MGLASYEAKLQKRRFLASNFFFKGLPRSVPMKNLPQKELGSYLLPFCLQLAESRVILRRLFKAVEPFLRAPNK